jgi:hypothetical protein
MFPWLRLPEEFAQRKIVINGKPSFERHTKNLPCWTSNQMSQSIGTLRISNEILYKWRGAFCTIIYVFGEIHQFCHFLRQLKFIVAKELERVPTDDATSVSGALALCPNI